MSNAPKPKKESELGGCDRCGRPVVLSKFTLCYECRADEKAEVERTLDYLKTHRGATLSQVAEAVKVDPQLVLRLIRGGRMEVMAQERMKKGKKQ
jgi:hypothetical protein